MQVPAVAHCDNGRNPYDLNWRYYGNETGYVILIRNNLIN